LTALTPGLALGSGLGGGGTTACFGRGATPGGGGGGTRAALGGGTSLEGGASPGG